MSEQPLKPTETWCPGTCGELMQGALSDGQQFHVTLPVKKYTRVKLRCDTAGDTGGRAVEIAGLLPWQVKMLTAARNVLSLYEGVFERSLPGKLSFEWHSELGVSVGAASSTADILCVADALFKLLAPKFRHHRNYSFELSKIAALVESSDGLAYPGICAVNQKTGSLVASPPWFPLFNVITIVPSIQIATSSIMFEYDQSSLNTFDSMLQSFSSACLQRSELEIAKLATLSARINQQFNYNPLLREVERQMSLTGALGMNLAHTGSMLGLLFESGESGQEKAQAKLEQLQESFPDCKIELTAVEPMRDWCDGS